jgi:hypothetical protein
MAGTPSHNKELRPWRAFACGRCVACRPRCVRSLLHAVCRVADVSCWVVTCAGWRAVPCWAVTFPHVPSRFAGLRPALLPQPVEAASRSHAVDGAPHNAHPSGTPLLCAQPTGRRTHSRQQRPSGQEFPKGSPGHEAERVQVTRSPHTKSAEEANVRDTRSRTGAKRQATSRSSYAARPARRRGTPHHDNGEIRRAA